MLNSKLYNKFDISNDFLEKIHYEIYVNILRREVEKEIAYVFDREGDLIIKVIGTATKIKFSPRNTISLKKSGYFILHNHPVEQWSLSLTDVLTAIHSDMCCCIQAITKDVIYSLIIKRPLPLNIDTFEDVIENIWFKQGMELYYENGKRIIETENHDILTYIVKNYNKYFDYQVISFSELKLL